MANPQDQNGSKANGLTTQPLPASQKVYVHNHRSPNVEVAMRAVTLSGAHNGHAANGNGHAPAQVARPAQHDAATTVGQGAVERRALAGTH